MKYTEIQEPFESKTNADVWQVGMMHLITLPLNYDLYVQDVTRKEVKGEKDDSDEEVDRSQPTNQVRQWHLVICVCLIFQCRHSMLQTMRRSMKSLIRCLSRIKVKWKL